MRSTASTMSCLERMTLAPTPMLRVTALLLVTTQVSAAVRLRCFWT